MVSQTDSVHTSPGHSSARLLRPSTGGLPDGLARHQTLYVAFPRSQYYAPSATLEPLQPQVVQSSRDGSQRFPRSHDCHLHSGLGRSWTPARCSLHPRRDPYACTPLAGTVRPGGPLAQSVLKPSYVTTHAILIIWQRVHALDALSGASSRSHTGVQAGGAPQDTSLCHRHSLGMITHPQSLAHAHSGLAFYFQKVEGLEVQTHCVPVSSRVPALCQRIPGITLGICFLSHPSRLWLTVGYLLTLFHLVGRW